MELLARRDQLVELKYKDRVFPNPTKDTDPCSDNHLGTSETRGSLMVCPALEKYAWEQLHLESLAAKKRREAAGHQAEHAPKWWKWMSRPAETRRAGRSSAGLFPCSYGGHSL